MVITYYEYDGERYDTFEEAEEDMRKGFDYEFVDYFETLLEAGSINTFDVLKVLRESSPEFYYSIYEKCFDCYKDDYLSEWQEEEEIYEEDE